MVVNRQELVNLMKEKSWSYSQLAEQLQISTAMLFRIIKGDRNPGLKFIYGLIDFCKRENLNPQNFISLPLVLTYVNNEKSKPTGTEGKRGD